MDYLIKTLDILENVMGIVAELDPGQIPSISEDLGDLRLMRQQLKKACGSETSEREQANENIPLVNNRTFIVTIECGEDTTDWKITAPNELAAKMTASANYNRKRFNILRCVEYGC